MFCYGDRRAENEAAKGGEALVAQARERESAMAQQVGNQPCATWPVVKAYVSSSPMSVSLEHLHCIGLLQVLLVAILISPPMWACRSVSSGRHLPLL
jgi:hypothetical protein